MSETDPAEVFRMADVGQFRMEIHHDWILIVYDIPRTKDYLRKKVIRALRKLGALRHTYSVYYLPFSKKALSIANRILKFGQVYVWQSRLTSDSQAEQLTQDYINKIMEGVQKVRGRVATIRESWPSLTLEAKKQRLQYTMELFNMVKSAANNLGLQLFNELSDLQAGIEALKEQCGGAT